MKKQQKTAVADFYHDDILFQWIPVEGKVNPVMFLDLEKMVATNKEPKMYLVVNRIIK